MPPKPPPKKPESANQSDEPGQPAGAQPARAVQQTAAQAKTPAKLPTRPPPVGPVPAKGVERAGQAPTGGDSQTAGPSGGFLPVKRVQARAGLAPPAGQAPVQAPVAARAGKRPEAAAGQAPTAARAGQEPNLQAPISARVDQAPAAIPGQAPTAVRAGKPQAGASGQAPTAERAGKPQAGTSGQAPTAERAGKPQAVTSGQAPTAVTAGQGPRVAGATSPRVARGRGAGPRGMGGAPGAVGTQARGGMIGITRRGGAVGSSGRGGKAETSGGMVDLPGTGGASGLPRKAGVADPSGSAMAGLHSAESPQARDGLTGAPKAAVRGEAYLGAGKQGLIPDNTGEPSSKTGPVDPTHKLRTNPFIVRATETALAIVIVGQLMIADLPLRKSVWIHFASASPTIPIAALFGVAALYHRNPLDKCFTLILLVFSLVCYVSSFVQIINRWREIKRNRAQRPPIWVTILQCNALQILTLIVDISLYVWYLTRSSLGGGEKKTLPGKTDEDAKMKQKQVEEDKNKQQDSASTGTYVSAQSVVKNKIK